MLHCTWSRVIVICPVSYVSVQIPEYRIRLCLGEASVWWSEKDPNERRRRRLPHEAGWEHAPWRHRHGIQYIYSSNSTIEIWGIFRTKATFSRATQYRHSKKERRKEKIINFVFAGTKKIIQWFFLFSIDSKYHSLRLGFVVDFYIV